MSALNPRVDGVLAHHRATTINAVNLKHRLRNIETDRANLTHGRLPSMWFALTQPPYGTSMPQSGRRPQHQKPTCPVLDGMSDTRPKADIGAGLPNVCSGPLADADEKGREY